MQFSNILTTSLLASMASAAVISKRSTTQDIINDIIGIDTNVRNLYSHLQASSFSSLATTIIQGVPTIVDIAGAHIFLQKGNVDAITYPGKVNPTDSLKIISTVEATLLKDNPATIQLLKSKKAEIERRGLKVAIIASLKLLLSDHDTLSGLLVPKLTLDKKGQERANTAVVVIHDAIADGIAYFSK